VGVVFVLKVGRVGLGSVSNLNNVRSDLGSLSVVIFGELGPCVGEGF
jgi:hypothetical protein